MPLRNFQITLQSATVSPGASGVKCGGVRTVVEVRDCLQDMAIGVESFWPTDSTGDVSVRVQDDLGIDKVAGGDPVVQSLAKRNGGHVCRLSETDPFRCLSYLYDQRTKKCRNSKEITRDTGT